MSPKPLPGVTTIVSLICGPDRRGLVALVSDWIFSAGGSIIDADQHTDTQANIFFQRIEWQVPNADAQKVADAFQKEIQSKHNLQVQNRLASDNPRIAIMVSKLPHCFHDLVLRFSENEIPGHCVCVVSNHSEMRPFAEMFDLPYYEIPVTKENKPQAEAQQIEAIQKHKADLVVMARYMQVLSPDFLNNVGAPVINIHHSFLPAFAGAKPYHQAYQRGVKILGATAHYATADLDEGPIIHQAVFHVSHRHTVADLIREGRDSERIVLAQAVRWHLEARILVYNNKTVVFN